MLAKWAVFAKMYYDLAVNQTIVYRYHVLSNFYTDSLVHFYCSFLCS